jgi:DNA repair protein RecO (recombination protein O)
VKRIESAALLVRSVPYGEADLVATFFAEETGKISAIVRGARRSRRRFPGALEPIHELVVVLEDRGKDLAVLREARILKPRRGITSDLAAMEAAGRALRWVRHLCPPRTPEPSIWALLGDLLGALDRRSVAELPLLAIFGLRLLAEVGYGLDLRRCVRCARPCPEGRAAFVDAAGGGLVCTSCGGARRTLDGDLRTVAVSVLLGAEPPMNDAQASELLGLVEDVMAAHADFDPAGAAR